MPRKKKKVTRQQGTTGLRWRGANAYYERAHPRLETGRIVKALGTQDAELAESYVGALKLLSDRGDWHVIERWRRDEVHISDIMRAVREGEYQKLRRLSADGTRLGDAVERFMQRTAATQKSKTEHTYRMATNLLVAKLGKDFPMAHLTVEQAEKWLHSPKKSAGGKVWSARSQGNARVICGALWQMVIEDEAEAARQHDAAPVVTLNPWKRAKVPEQRTTRHGFLSPERWQSLIAHPEVAGTREAAFLGCACLAGLRQMEIVHLRTGEDVDFTKGVVRVQDRKGGEAWTAKKARSQRDVPMVADLRALLERHVALGFSGERYFFRAWERDKPVTSMAALAWTKRAFEVAGIRYGRTGDALTLHSLRHTFASWLAQEAVPFHVIADLMGNTAPVVISTYAHLSPNDKDRAMKIIQDKASRS